MPYPVAAARNKNFNVSSYNAKVLSLSPLAFWPLNETSGTAAVNLASTSGNGAYTGVDLAQSQTPFIAPLFDGANDYCNIYSSWLNTNWNRSEYTFSIWVKPYDAGVWTDGTQRRLFWILTTAVQEAVGIYRTTTNGQFRYNATLGGTAKTVSLASQAWTEWKHVAITNSKSGDAMMAYLDGVQVGVTQTSLGTSSGNNISSGVCNIGAASTTPTEQWNGWLAYAALWNRALSATEVAKLAVI